MAGLAQVAALLLALAAQEGPYAAWTNGPPKDPAFFPVAVWLQNPRHAAAYKAAGINVYVGLYRGPTAEQLAQLKAAGIRAVVGQNAAALALKDDPAIVGWLQRDEPDNAQAKPGGGYGPPVPPADVVERYRKMREADPTRPVLLNLGQGVAWDDYVGRGVRTRHPEDYAEYLKDCDIASFDIYPVVHDKPEVSGKLWYVPRGVQRLREWSKGQKVVWNCVEAARIDSEKAKPTADQVRAEVWMSLVHGSTGIVYFVHQFKPSFVEASLLQDAELLRGVTAVNRQIHELAPVLNSATVADGATVASSNPEAPVAAMAKVHGGATWVFAVGMRDVPVRATVALKGAPRQAAAEVLGEDRTVPVREGRFEDDFGPYAVRLYRVR